MQDRCRSRFCCPSQKQAAKHRKNNASPAVCARLANFIVMHSRADLRFATGRAYLCTHRRECLPVPEPLQFATSRGCKHSASCYLIDRHNHSAGPVNATVRRQHPASACARCGEGA